MTSAHFDAIVIGLGGIGSAVCAALASRGVRVLDIDRHSPPHDRGSSHGATRIIRRAYFEHPNYVPLVERAYQLWEQLEQETGRRLLTRCGLLQIGPGEGTVLRGVMASVIQHRLTAEKWTAAETRKHFPLFSFPDDWSAVWEPGAGYLAVEDCVAAQIESARRHGATLQLETVVHGFRQTGSSVQVTTSAGEYHAEQIVVAPGPWSPGVLADADLSLRVLRKQLHWFGAPGVFSVDSGFPTFLVDTPGGVFYGFPAIDERGLKVAEHTGGEEVTDPDVVSRELEDEDARRVAEFVRGCFPQCGQTRHGHAVCFYTMTRDEHFIVDCHPAMDRVHLAVGFSGHGFKFAPVIGEVLADRVTGSATDLPVDFLRIRT